MNDNNQDYRLPVITELICVFAKNGVGAEIGVAKGKLSIRLLNNEDVKHLYLIDPWLGRYTKIRDTNSKNQAEMDRRYNNVVKMCEEFPNKSTILRKTSKDASKDIPDGSLDFVYIDANHEEEEVYNDLKYWIPKVKQGGLVMGDDWYRGFPGVVDGVVKYVSEHYPFVKPVKNYYSLGLECAHTVCPTKSPLLNKCKHQWWGIRK